MSKQIACLALGGGLIAGACAQPTYTFHYHPPVGKALHYTVKSTTRMTGSKPTSFEMTGAVTTTAVKFAGGKYTVVTSVDRLDSKGPGADQLKKMLVGTKSTMLVDANGKVVSSSGSGGAGGMLGGLNGTESLPQHAVRVGGTWSTTTPMGKSKLTMNYKLVRVATVGGVQIATIAAAPSGVPAGVTQRTTMQIEVATGIMRSMTMDSKTSSSPSMTMHMTMKLR